MREIGPIIIGLALGAWAGMWLYDKFFRKKMREIGPIIIGLAFGAWAGMWLYDKFFRK
jgi:uncharacterized protein YneF (UPF0154 family)